MTSESIEYIAVGKLMVDPTVQRYTDPKRVEKMAETFDPAALGVLTLSRRTGGAFYVIDGAHRAGAAMAAHGEAYEVPCRVFRSLTIEAEARMFRLLNNTAKVDALALFRVRLVEGEETAVAINAIAEGNGWKMADQYGNPRNGLAAVAAMERTYRRDPEALTRSLATIVRAWGNEAPANDGKLIEGFGLLYQRHGESAEVTEMVAKLSPYPGGPGALLGRAKGLRDLIGVTIPHAVAEILVEVYNKGRRTRALPPWRSA